MRCPICANRLDEDNYCSECLKFFDDDELSQEDENAFDVDDDFNSLDNQDYDSMVNNGDAICLNCTYWSVSPYGASYGMVCRKGYFSEGPGDSCGDFMQEYHFASYGDNGEFQFNETERAISNKLYYWKNSR